MQSSDKGYQATIVPNRILTSICQRGMKSALWRTLSKIRCSWGLMKLLSWETVG